MLYVAEKKVSEVGPDEYNVVVLAVDAYEPFYKTVPVFNEDGSPVVNEDGSPKEEIFLDENGERVFKDGYSAATYGEWYATQSEEVQANNPAPVVAPPTPVEEEAAPEVAE